MSGRIGRGVGLSLSVLCLVMLAGCGKKPVLSLNGQDARLVGKWAGEQIATVQDDGSDEAAEFGRIALQEPAGGQQTHAGARITLFMSLGETGLATVPNVVGSTYDEAEKVIEENCLQMGRILYVQSAEIPAGSVVSQEPAAGTQTQALSVVQVTVSLGQPHSSECIPDFSGITGWRAVRQHLMAYGLVVEVAFEVGEGTSLPGTCAVSAPNWGTEDCPLGARFGDTVRLLVSLGPQGTVGVPSVVGLRLWEARDRLIQSGVTVGDVWDVSVRQGVREPDPWTTPDPLSATVTFAEDTFEITHSTEDADALWQSVRVSGPYAADTSAEPGKIDMGAKKLRVTARLMSGFFNLVLASSLGDLMGGPGATSHGIYEFTDDGKLLLVVTSVNLENGLFGANSAAGRPESVSEALEDSDLIVYELTRQE